MNRTMKIVLVVVVIVIASTSASFAKEENLGGWLRKQRDTLDEKLSQENVQKHINNASDRIADNVIDYATPEADERTRKAQRDAIGIILNPSKSGSNRRLDSLIENVTNGGVNDRFRRDDVSTNPTPDPTPESYSKPSSSISSGNNVDLSNYNKKINQSEGIWSEIGVRLFYLYNLSKKPVGVDVTSSTGLNIQRLLVLLQVLLFSAVLLFFFNIAFRRKNFLSWILKLVVVICFICAGGFIFSLPQELQNEIYTKITNVVNISGTDQLTASDVGGYSSFILGPLLGLFGLLFYFILPSAKIRKIKASENTDELDEDMLETDIDQDDYQSTPVAVPQTSQYKSNVTVEERLIILNDLMAKKLISKEVYVIKEKEILEEL